MAQGHSEQFHSCHVTPDALLLTHPCGLATGNGVGMGGSVEGPSLVEPRDKL
jgi:hypothetical protein